LQYSIEMRSTPTHLHFTVTGVNTRDHILRYMDDVVQQALALGRRALLVEERLDGPRLQTMDVFEIMSQGSERLRGLFDSVAYVDVNRVGQLMAFAEDVAVNRGFPLRTFGTVEEAERWLAERARIPAVVDPP
jgi:hypothetical protein